MSKQFYVSILGELSQQISKERDLISKIPVICCDFVSHFKYLFFPVILFLQFCILSLEKGSKLCKLTVFC